MTIPTLHHRNWRHYMCKPRHTREHWLDPELVHFDDDHTVLRHETQHNLFLEVPRGLKPGDRGCRALDTFTARYLGYIE